MKTLVIFLFLAISLNVFAGYECRLSLAHSEDFHKTIIKGKISATDRDLRTIHLKEFFIEEKTSKKTISLAIQAAIVGWVGEEEVTLAMFRRTQTKKSIESTLISEKVTVKGNDANTLWFDNYKLDVACTMVT